MHFAVLLENSDVNYCQDNVLLLWCWYRVLCWFNR